MKVIVITKNNSRFEREDVWEIQDNGHKELVIKLHDHECIRFEEEIIKSVKVEL